MTNKYGAQRTEVDGVTFASKAEARRYGELMLLRRAGVISGLELQPRFPIVVNGVKVCVYVGDFRYVEDGRVVIEDVKGRATPVFRLKAKLMRAVHGVTITEVAAR